MSFYSKISSSVFQISLSLSCLSFSSMCSFPIKVRISQSNVSVPRSSTSPEPRELGWLNIKEMIVFETGLLIGPWTSTS